MPGEVKAGEMTEETNLSQILNDEFRGEQKANSMTQEGYKKSYTGGFLLGRRGRKG